MKKSILAFLIIFIHFTVFSQSSETEPNNNFGEANSWLRAVTAYGSMGGVDTADYFGLDFDKDGTFYMVITIANTGNNGPQQVEVTLFNSLTDNDEYVGNFYAGGYSLNEGESYTDYISVCSRARDSFYLVLSSLGNIDYNITWYQVDSYTPDDLGYYYNNTAVKASPFNYNVEQEATMGYEFWGWPEYDTLDYFKSTLPAANYDSVSLTINATNTGCDGNAWITYTCYKNGSSTPFASGFVGGNSSVLPGHQVFSTIPLDNMTQGDELLVRFATSPGSYSSTRSFGYHFKYGIEGEFDEDPEDNCCTNNAIPFIENQVKTGNVGEYDQVNDDYLDQFDTYRIILPHDGAVNLIVKARNDDDYFSDDYFEVEIQDKFGSYLEYHSLIHWEGSPIGELRFDTIKLRAFEADTFYLRFTASEKTSYNIKYQLVDSTASDADDMYNGPVTTILPINVGEVKKGHVRFKKTRDLFDPSDIYKTTLDADSKIAIYLKATYRGDYDGSNASSDKKLSFITSNFEGLTPANPPVQYFTPDGVYLDTFYVCGLGAGDLYFTLSSNLPYEYEFRYEIIDSSSTDNDIEPNNSIAEATVVSGADTKQGHINYRSNVVTDMYDYYKMIYYSSDSLKIPLQATNTSCKDNQTITFNGYNQSTQIFSKVKSNVAAGQTVYDTVKIAVTAPNTIYLRAYATAAFKYQFSTNPRLPTSTFILTGDTAVCNGATVYTATNMHNEQVTYHWSLPLGGGTLSFADSVATVTWNGSGTRNVQLYLSNSVGNSQINFLNVNLDSAVSAQMPVILNFARTLSVSGLPARTHVQWFRNGNAITGAVDSFYYASLAGNYTAKFRNNCGDGTASAPYSFAADVIAQTITFPHTLDQEMTPVLKIKLPATASSGLPVFYTKISGLATVENDSLLITGVGTIIIKAAQPGNDEYSDAATEYDTISVVKGTQVITFNPLPDRFFRNSPFFVYGTSSVGLPVIFSIESGNAGFVGFDDLVLGGAGNITVQASQTGNENYYAATPVQQSFCVGVDTLNAISGAATACLNTYTYTAQDIPGANFVWTLNGGGTMTTHNDTAFVTWTDPGTHTLKVKANSSCNLTFSNEPQKQITIANVVPTVVRGMTPANGSINQSLPLPLSWIPGNYTETYDLFVWDSSTVQPSTAYQTDLTDISFTIPQNEFPYNTTYKWRIVSKNPCNQIIGPIQTFRLIPLPDLAVTSVLAPTSAISGQNISISWTVKNVGPGATPVTGTWQDAVYLSFDTIPDFSISPDVNPILWSAINFPVRALLLGTRNNVTALQPGEQYTNSIDFTIPINYNLPYYAYVITNHDQNAYQGLVEVTKVNDTARATNPIIVTLAPTPDLRVDSVFAPATVFSGNVINVAYKTKNYGVLTPTESSWTDQVYLSQSILFDSANAILLKGLNYDGSYYPDAPNAAANINTQLQNDSFYYGNIQAVIPNFIFGQWFIHVKANDKHTLYEGVLQGNNVNNNPVQVYLSPTPKLTIQNLNLPLTQASTTQSIGINYSILNEGFNDNIEKNRAQYYSYLQPCSLSCHRSNPNSICPPGMLLRDSTGFGGSYWKDRVYLSTDPSGLNIGQSVLLMEQPHGNPITYIYQQVQCVELGNPAYYNNNTENVLHPAVNFATNADFVIPDTLSPGTYYIYVYANADKSVFEYPGTPEIKRTGALVINRPDVVPAISAPANAIAGNPIQINYDVNNVGAGNVYNHLRSDNIYISLSPVFDGSAVLIETKTYTENISGGTPVHHAVSYTLPPAESGVRYFYVETNADNDFAETNTNNNISAAAMVNFAVSSPVDLLVSSITTLDTIRTGLPSEIYYTTTNAGTGIAAGNWTDSLFISCSPGFSSSTAYYIANKTLNRTIQAGQSRIDTFSLTIPFTFDINSCFVNNNYNNAYFFIKTNSDQVVYEGVNTGNNTGSSGLKVVDNALVDLKVTTVTGAASATVGFPYTVNWKVKNIGRKPDMGYGLRYDSLFVSPDSVYNGNAIGLAHKGWTELLATNEIKSHNVVFNFANVPTGQYYILAKTNTAAQYNITAEKNFANNVNVIRDANGVAKLISVARPLLPDLVDSIISAPSSGVIGQPITVIHQIKNIGTGTTNLRNIYNEIALASDPSGTPLNFGLSSKLYTTELLPGESLTDTLQLYIPAAAQSRLYVLYFKTDWYNSIVESNENNNEAASYINLFTPNPSDLIVQNVTVPDTAILGYIIDSARWIVKNNSGVTAAGYTSDGVYLSSSPVFDSTATLMGIKSKIINMPPLAKDTLSLGPLIKGITEGNYYLHVNTDLQNQLPEINEINNNGVSASQVYVKVKELTLNLLENNTLANVERYYKFIVPDSLYGATFSVKLTSNDSLTRINQLFIGKGYVPDPAHFDYTYPNANYGNQDVVMTYVTSGTYYVTVRAVNPGEVVQNITLIARKLPFEISSVQTNSGGNIGNVTVKISGSLFTTGMTAKLNKPGTEIIASAVYFTNSTVVYATFNLQGKPLGVYDVTLSKADTSFAVLNNGFSVVQANNGGLITGGGTNTGSGNGNAPGCDPGAESGLNSQLVTELFVPSLIFRGWPFVIVINYNNPTNFDIPAQVRTLYAEDIIKLALTPQGVQNGVHSITVQLTEQGGPPGIIRAGGSGSFYIYARSNVDVPAHTITLYSFR